MKAFRPLVYIKSWKCLVSDLPYPWHRLFFSFLHLSYTFNPSFWRIKAKIFISEHAPEFIKYILSYFSPFVGFLQNCLVRSLEILGGFSSDWFAHSAYCWALLVFKKKQPKNQKAFGKRNLGRKLRPRKGLALRSILKMSQGSYSSKAESSFGKLTSVGSGWLWDCPTPGDQGWPSWSLFLLLTSHLCKGKPG